MISRTSVITLKHQQGLALLVLVIILVFAFTAYLFSGLSITQIRMEQAKNTLTTLKKAKQAVINYAATSRERSTSGDYGLLPCPETFFNGKDGNMTGYCGGPNTNAVEWLPWRSLDLPTLKDESGTCLFYAVSGTYKLGGSQSDMINEDSLGMFQLVDSAGNILEGLNLEDQIVALVIAPGEPLPGQVRNPLFVTSSCGRDYVNQAAYLEGNGAINNSTVSALVDTVDQFIHATETSATESPAYNDKFLTISRDEIWDAIVRRDDFKQKMENLTQGLAMCLAEYANMTANTRRLPWPVITDFGVKRTDYRENDNYVDDDGASEGYSGRFPFNVANSNDAIWPAATIPAGVVANLFEIIDPASIPAPPPPPPAPPPPPQLCGNLILTSGPDAGTAIDLYSAASTYRKLWNNWKDHFFYVLSKKYEPASTAATRCPAVASCIRVNGMKYAAAVIFSGSRLPGVSRNDKEVVADYLESSKAIEFANEATSKAGDRNYLYTNPQTDTVNDVMYCIEDKVNTSDDLTVVECL